MDAQRKVTCFVTRGSGDAAQLCVFWHAGGGIQVPAGTVEDGESFDDGARREAFEETNLTGLELASYLGSRIYELKDEWSVLCRDVELRIAPEAGAPVTRWKLRRNWNVDVVERRPGFARIVYAEDDPEAPGGIVYARFEGWVSEDDLYQRQERRFYHFRAPAGSPDEWRVLENGTHDFHVYWVPLSPRPSLLKPCQLWLDEHYDALLAATRNP